jgi:ATP-dependent protease HslVU (ClpYQ) peptidase subunit
MTTIVVVKKNGYAAIAADTLTKWGTVKESAVYIANHDKILTVGNNYLAVAGGAAFKAILNEHFSRRGVPARFRTTAEVFRTWNALHRALKDNYYLQPTEDKEDPLESSRMDVLIANSNGIFGAAADRTVQEFVKYYAFGSGADYALGLMYGLYDDPKRSAENIARLAVEAAADFDDGTGLPVVSHAVKLRG